MGTDLNSALPMKTKQCVDIVVLEAERLFVLDTSCAPMPRPVWLGRLSARATRSAYRREPTLQARADSTFLSVRAGRGTPQTESCATVPRPIHLQPFESRRIIARCILKKDLLHGLSRFLGIALLSHPCSRADDERSSSSGARACAGTSPSGSRPDRIRVLGRCVSACSLWPHSSPCRRGRCNEGGSPTSVSALVGLWLLVHALSARALT